MSGSSFLYPGMGAPPGYVNDPVTGVPIPFGGPGEAFPATPGTSLSPSPLSRLMPWLSGKLSSPTVPPLSFEPTPPPAEQPPPAAPSSVPAQSALPFSGPQTTPEDLSAFPGGDVPSQTPGGGAMPLPTPPVPPTSPPPAPGPAPSPEAPQAAPEAPPAPTDTALSNNRRNNPLNLRFAGQEGAVNDGGFAAFQTPEAGVAAAKNQFAIDVKKGINTLRGLISSWAPPNENDTEAYIKNVSARTGIDPDAKVDITDPAFQAKVIPAMSLMENGPAKGGQAPSAPAAPAATPGVGAPPIPQPVQQPTPAFMAAQGFPGVDPRAYVGGPGDQLIALGSGLSGAPSLGAGFSKAGQNLLALGQGNREMAMKGAQYGLESKKLDQQIGYQNATLNLKEAPKNFGTPIKGQDGKMYQPMRDGSGHVTYSPLAGTTTAQQGVDVRSAPKPFGQPVMVNGVSMQPMRDGAGAVTMAALPGTTAAQDRVGIANKALDMRYDPALKANLTNAGESAKDAAKDIEGLQNSRMADTQSLAENEQARALVAANPAMMGQTLTARATRALAEMGLTGSTDANNLDAIQKMTSGARNSYLNSVTGGHMGSLRSFASMSSISKAVADVGTNPQAAQYILDLQSQMLRQKMDWRDKVLDLQDSDPSQVVGSRYLTNKDKAARAWAAENKVPDYADYAGGSAPPPPGASGGRPPLSSFGSK